MWSTRLLVCTLLLAGLAHPATAQDPTAGIYIIDVDAEETYGELIETDVIDFEITVTDSSRDSTGGFTGEPGAAVQPHSTSWDFELANNTDMKGWGIYTPGITRTSGGESKTVILRVAIIPTQIVQPLLQFDLIASTRTPAGEMESRISFAVLSFGPDNFNVNPRGSMQIKPGQIDSGAVVISNGNLLPRAFGVEVVQNPCGLTVAYAPTVLVGPKSEVVSNITVRGPTDKPYYNSELCDLKVRVFPADSSATVRDVPLGVAVSGLYIKTEWQITAAFITFAVFLIVLFVVRRKAILEEELLGKPQRPWTIPVERVYLEHLEQRDPRAAYVVRHFLMEEEYQSALLWYKGYKQATRGERAKESLVVRQEKTYKRFRASWKGRIAAPIKKADRLEAKLQKKLDRQAKGDVRAQRRKWKKTVAKLEAAHESRHAKAMGRWEKSAAKAQKKGQPQPERPALEPLDLPPEPGMDRLLLANHKWQKKVDKLRRKMVRKQGNLEVKFEKKDARKVRTIRRKVHKIAKRIDDPDFISEHPLMADALAE